MAKITHLVLGMLILLIHVNAAPSDVSKIEDIVELEQVDPILDSEPKAVENENTNQTQRQKRWYNHFGYGFPPISPVIYPSFTKRDESAHIGNYGYDDPFTQIHRRLQEIANVVRQPPPPPSHIPIFYPVVFVPTFGCGCDETTTKKPQTGVDESTETIPDVTERWPEMEDERQNWGFVVNNTESDDDVDYSRPISFNPIKSDKPLKRPSPPVEHGTIIEQANSVEQSTTTTEKPSPNQLSANNNPTLTPPSPCDSAILSCCHQQNVVYDCFAAQGCPDLSSYGSPCNSSVILKVIEKFRKYYGQRSE